jgi:ribonuclease R
MSLVTGYFEGHRDGYGFAILDKPGERDVFIPARSTCGAMNNDRIVVRVENRRRREGRIIRILERSCSRIAGSLERGRNAFFVRPKRRSVAFDLLIPEEDLGDAKDGDNVIAEIVTYQTDKRPAMGRIIKTVLKPQTPSEDIEMIIEELGLPKRFPHAVLEEARALPDLRILEAKDHINRRDLRSVATVTIDGEKAKDFDDAISISKIASGYRLLVHIADVGHYVHWDSAIDKEARMRGTSVYFADRVIPMLPKELSEDLCSLKPKVDRLAFTVEMEFDDSGERISQSFYPSLIHSNERMTYTAVRQVLIDKEPEMRHRYSELISEFALMGELCDRIKAIRMNRGSLDFDLPEPEVLLDLQGRPEDIIKTERNYAHTIIEEFMIAANEAVAEYLENNDSPCIYRIHEEPDVMKLDEITSVAVRLGVLDRKKGIKIHGLSSLLAKASGTDAEEIINHMVLRSLKQAKYATQNVGHFGLASGSYCHFTSPIRRYPDLVVHRLLREILLTGKNISGQRRKELESLLQDIAFHSSRTERVADEAERNVLNAMRVWFMKDRIGEAFAGKVVSVSQTGLRVRLRDYFVEGFLHVSNMTDDYYEYNEKNICLTGLNRKKSFGIGKEIRVRIENVSIEDREIVLGV